MKSKLIEVLKDNGWNIEKNSSKFDGVLKNFEKLPNDLKKMLFNYKTISDQNDVAWFSTLAEINGETESEFGLYELKNQSLDAALNQLQINKINNFWDKHFCFFMSVKNGYSYLAICLEGKNKNKIVFGYEPEYEDIEVVFDSFDDFSNQLIEYILNKVELNVFEQLF